MSHYEYIESLRISANDPGFYALLMAAILKADDVNYRKLMHAWPELVEERRERYNAPGGYLPGEEPRQETE